MKTIYLILMAIISFLAFFFYGADKQRAKHKVRRYSEKFLIGIGQFLGAPGALIGMACFHHKTRKRYFWISNLIGLGWQVIVLIVMFVIDAKVS